jgi:hypothetical protein
VKATYCVRKKWPGFSLGSHAVTFLQISHQISLVDIFAPGPKTLLGRLQKQSALIIGMKKLILKLTQTKIVGDIL